MLTNSSCHLRYCFNEEEENKQGKQVANSSQLMSPASQFPCPEFLYLYWGGNDFIMHSRMIEM